MKCLVAYQRVEAKETDTLGNMKEEENYYWYGEVKDAKRINIIGLSKGCEKYKI